ncbi:MAG: proline dehydrogenase family protein, partial [Crocinitomicaceae bacterium]
SVEGKTSDDDFDKIVDIIIETIQRAKNDKNIPFAVFKVSGIGRFDLLEKASDNSNQFTEHELVGLNAIKSRVEKICQKAFENQVSVFIDAEETWIQDIIDQWTNE